MTPPIPELCKYHAFCKWYDATSYNCNNQTPERLFCGAFKSLEADAMSSPFNKTRPQSQPTQTDESERDTFENKFDGIERP